MNVFKNKILMIVVLSFVASLAYSFWYRISPVVDAQAYDRIAVNFIAGNGFREDTTQSFDHDSAMLRAGPGYEFFLAIIYRYTGHHYEVVWIMQALLHALTAWLIYKSALFLWPDKKIIGLIAAGAIGFHPDLIEISAMVMTETLYLFFVALIIYLFVKLMSQRSILIVGLFGLTLGLGILTRPPLMLFMPIILFYFLVKKYWREAILFISVLIVVMTPWTIRNYRVYHRFIPTTLIGDYNLWVGNTLLSNGGQISGGFNPVTTYVADYGVRDLSTASQSAFRSFIIEHPDSFAKLTAMRLIRYASLIRPMGFWFYDQGWSQIIFVALSGVSIALLFIFGLTGLLLGLIERDDKKWYLIALALTAPLPLLATVVESRYRFQIYPFLALFGACAFSQLMEKKVLTRKVFLISVVVLVGLSLIDVGMSWDVVIEHLNRF